MAAAGRRSGGNARHLLRALLGDDDVALLFGGGLVVDILQRIGPGLAGSLAGAGRIEFLAVAERVRQRRIGLAADRHRRVDVFAGVAIAEQRGFGRRAQRLAGLFVVGEAPRHGGEGDRKISAVAGADADRAIGSGLRPEIGARYAGLAGGIVAAEQIVEEIARALRRRGGILRAAIILRQRGQHRAALIVAICAAAAAQPLEAAGDLIEIGPHLLNLGVDRAALRRLTREQREEAGTVAALPLGLRRHAIEFGLLLVRGILIAADLVVPGRIAGAAAAIDARQLRFQPRAHRIGRCAPVRAAAHSGSSAPKRQRRAQRRPAPRRRPKSIWRRRCSAFQAYPAIRTIPRGLETRTASAASHSRFSGQRHVVSGAPVWQGNRPLMLPWQDTAERFSADR